MWDDPVCPMDCPEGMVALDPLWARRAKLVSAAARARRCAEPRPAISVRPAAMLAFAVCGVGNLVTASTCHGPDRRKNMGVR